MQNNKQILAPQVKLTSGSCPYFYNMYRCCCETSLKLVYMCQFCTRFTGTGIVFIAGFRTCFNPTPNINLTYGYMFVLNWMYSAQSFPIETASTHTNTHTHTHTRGKGKSNFYETKTAFSRVVFLLTPLVSRVFFSGTFLCIVACGKYSHIYIYIIMPRYTVYRFSRISFIDITYLRFSFRFSLFESSFTYI